VGFEIIQDLQYVLLPSGILASEVMNCSEGQVNISPKAFVFF
jgi:hypothetical protein